MERQPMNSISDFTHTEIMKMEHIFNHTQDPCVTHLSELVFEARSSKDSAWYDIASFLSCRDVSSGDLEIRVRFVGFGREPR